MNKILEAILSDRWAITTEALDSLMAIAFSDIDIEALEKVAGKYLQNTEGFVTVRDGVATIAISGPIFARETFVSWLMGWPSYDVLARDFNTALTNPDVTGIILQINSPGGQVDGASEFSQHIMAARGVKPVHAYVSGTAASAAYWIASAAEQIHAVDTAIVGSIGTQMGIRMIEGRAGEKSYTFISSQSPLKNADPGTDAGAKEMQAMVDALAQVFIDAVAVGRNTTAKNVVESFGKGGVFVASEAQKRGMIDGISTYEKVIQSLREGVETMELEKATAADLVAKRPELVEQIRAEALAGVQQVDAEAVRQEAVTAERARISGIEAFAVAGAEEVVAACKADGSTPEQAAVKILQHVQAKGVQTAKPEASKTAAELEALRKDELGLDKPSPQATDLKDKGGDPVAAVLADAEAVGVIRKQ